ncbi:hypothetical protein BJ508DRAFT_378326 [Ascobolus immersus RN42]|uniref:Uncharacterized protein n=1 Tax=Ascobolus immersus RN42 TaxID=1160509 RepID=A0A3N4HZ50_ASCIM|nr:hypothetical protein BJ508DRAFT_378326 [Ascobolus immersus RN42]
MTKAKTEHTMAVDRDPRINRVVVSKAYLTQQAEQVKAEILDEFQRITDIIVIPEQKRRSETPIIIPVIAALTTKMPGALFDATLTIVEKHFEEFGGSAEVEKKLVRLREKRDAALAAVNEFEVEAARCVYLASEMALASEEGDVKARQGEKDGRRKSGFMGAFKSGLSAIGGSTYQKLT